MAVLLAAATLGRLGRHETDQIVQAVAATDYAEILERLHVLEHTFQPAFGPDQTPLGVVILLRRVAN